MMGQNSKLNASGLFREEIVPQRVLARQEVKANTETDTYIQKIK